MWCKLDRDNIKCVRLPGRESEESEMSVHCRCGAGCDGPYSAVLTWWRHHLRNPYTRTAGAGRWFQ